MMKKVINISERGSLTLPQELRQRLGVKNGGQLVVEETGDGVLLRAGATFPVEIYSETRLAELKRHNDEALSRYEFKKKG